MLKTEEIQNAIDIYLKAADLNYPAYISGVEDARDVLLEISRINDKSEKTDLTQCASCKFCKKTAATFCKKFDMVVEDYDFCSFGEPEG